jgi:hypothetical protein
MEQKFFLEKFQCRDYMGNMLVDMATKESKLNRGRKNKT